MALRSEVGFGSLSTQRGQDLGFRRGRQVDARLQAYCRHTLLFRGRAGKGGFSSESLSIQKENLAQKTLRRLTLQPHWAELSYPSMP